MAFKLFLIVLIPLLIILLLGMYRTWKTQTSANQKLFLSGKVPQPDGFLKGYVNGYNGSWKGKKFDATNSAGINVLEENGKKEDKYPFKTYVAKGLQDKNLDVLKIDYNIPGNSFWVRLIVDELVETEPGKYLGKINIKILPNFAFAIGYFSLVR